MLVSRGAARHPMISPSLSELSLYQYRLCCPPALSAFIKEGLFTSRLCITLPSHLRRNTTALTKDNLVCFQPSGEVTSHQDKASRVPVFWLAYYSGRPSLVSLAAATARHNPIPRRADVTHGTNSGLCFEHLPCPPRFIGRADDGQRFPRFACVYSVQTHQ